MILIGCQLSGSACMRLHANFPTILQWRYHRCCCCCLMHSSTCLTGPVVSDTHRVENRHGNSSATHHRRQSVHVIIHGRHNRLHHGSEVINCYVIVHVSGIVGRIASGISPIFPHFCVDDMVLGTNNVVH